MTMSDDEMIAEATYALTGEEMPPRSVVEALTRVVRDMPAVGKGEKMAGESGGYRYRGIEAMTAAAQPLFGRHGVLVCPKVLESTTEAIQKNNKPWVHRTMKVSYTLRGLGGRDDLIEVGPFVAEADDNSDKSANKCMTQAFKQMLLQLLVISDRKDDPDEHNQDRDAPRQEPVDAPVSPETLEMTLRNVVKSGYAEEEFTQQIPLVTGRDDGIVLKSEWPRLRDAWAAYKHDHPKDRDASPAAGVLPGDGEPAPVDTQGRSEASNEAHDTSQGFPPGTQLGSRARKP